MASTMAKQDPNVFDNRPNLERRLYLVFVSEVPINGSNPYEQFITLVLLYCNLHFVSYQQCFLSYEPITPNEPFITIVKYLTFCILYRQ